MSKDVEQFGLREAINVHLKCLRVRSELLSRLLLLLLLYVAAAGLLPLPLPLLLSSRRYCCR